MNLYELWKQLDKIIGVVGYKKAAEMPVTLVINNPGSPESEYKFAREQFEIEKPLHEIALGKNAVHLIDADV